MPRINVEMSGDRADFRDQNLAAGDSPAWAAVYRRYERPLLAFFMRRLGQPDLAADLTAEVFAAAFIGRAGYRADDAPFHVWLFGIAQHKLIDSLRRGQVEDDARRRLQMRAVRLSDADLGRIELVGSDQVVADMLAGLPATEQAAIRARILDDGAYAEIAEQLACSEAVVRKRVSRGLARLRDQIDRGTA